MKVESSKTNHAADRKASLQNKNVNQTNVLLNKADLPDSAPPPPASKSFAQILEETRNQNSGDDDNFLTSRKKETSESDEAKNEKETSRDVQTRDAVEEKERKQSDEQESGDGSDGDANPGFGAFVFQADNKIFNSNSVPAARSILHVADLERIVSAVRAQNLKNAQAIVIALKHSVLEGLQIRLTVEENGKLKAEFLASSEQIKNQLEARRGELTSIIRERGINLAEMNVRQGSNFSQNGETDDNSLSGENVSTPELKELSLEESPEDSDNESNNRISYRV